MVRSGFDIAAMTLGQVRQVFRLQVLNRFASSLPSLIRSPRITPLQWYLALRELLGELLSDEPNADISVPEYDHDNLALTFKDLVERILGKIKGGVAVRFDKIELVRVGAEFIASGVKPEFFELPEYYLAVETSEDRARVAKHVQDELRFKMLPASMVKLAAVRGVKLVLDHNPPPSLPSSPGLSYFRLMTADPMSESRWNLIKKEQSVGVKSLAMDLPDVRFTLYGLLPTPART
jgi:predicted component of type VI protein secretion system